MGTTINRKLASVQRIEEIRDIDGADSIQAYRVGGWWVVDKKHQYVVGELAVFISIDSWVPHSIAPFLSKGQEPCEYNGVRGERLRTIRLRNTLSQGLILPIGVLGEVRVELIEGTDVSELLGIQKWEAPIPAQLAGEARGSFPGFIPKTDQERIQNLSKELAAWIGEGLQFEVTEKLDGSSMTVYTFAGDEGVCPRNLNLLETKHNTLWSVCRRERLLDKIAGRDIALQGELIGEGIQGNPYKIKGQDFFVFDIFDIGAGRYLSPQERVEFCKTNDIKHVPVLVARAELVDTLGLISVDQILGFAEGKSVQGSASPQREGVVFKCIERPHVSFKAISNVHLLQEK